MKILNAVVIMLEAAVLLGLFMMVQFLNVRAQYKFCIRYSFLTKHMLNMTSCSFTKNGIVTQCEMTFRDYSYPRELNEFVEKYIHELFNKSALAGWIEELLEADVIVKPENKEKPFALRFHKNKLMAVLNEFDGASDVVLKKYDEQGAIGRFLLKEDYEFLKLFKDEMVKEMHYIDMKKGNVICLCGEK